MNIEFSVLQPHKKREKAKNFVKKQFNRRSLRHMFLFHLKQQLTEWKKEMKFATILLRFIHITAATAAAAFLSNTYGIRFKKFNNFSSDSGRILDLQQQIQQKTKEKKKTNKIYLIQSKLMNLSSNQAYFDTMTRMCFST